MRTSQFEKVALSFFPLPILELFKDEHQYGFNNYKEKDIKRIGYCINLTMDTIKLAIENHIDLILTHHNIWEDYVELRDDCLKLLERHGIIHFYNHLPLDSAPFGPSRMLLKDLGLIERESFCRMGDLAFGVVGELDTPVTIEAFKERLEQRLGHNVRLWCHNETLVKRVGIVAGSGGDLETLNEAVKLGCDTYITGEKKLKTLLYTRHMKMNFLLGSHTFTELSGLTEYARLIQEKLMNGEFVLLNEEFIE